MNYSEQEEKKYVCVDEVIDRLYDNEFATHCPLDEVSDVICNTPTADVVEVVRCKECAVPHNKWTGCPNLNGLIPPPGFYCAKGERRKDNEL